MSERFQVLLYKGADLKTPLIGVVWHELPNYLLLRTTNYIKILSKVAGVRTLYLPINTQTRIREEDRVLFYVNNVQTWAYNSQYYKMSLYNQYITLSTRLNFTYKLSKIILFITQTKIDIRTFQNSINIWSKN